MAKNPSLTSAQRPRAVIYARVSSKEQDKEGYSNPAQLKLLKSYAEEHGFSIVQEYTDVETAKKAGRTNFGQMISYLKKQQSGKHLGQLCRTILVEKTDRLYRNLKDWVTLDELDLDIHFVKEGVILSKESRSAEKFMHGIKVLMAKNYIDNLSEETKKGMIEKAEQGIYPSYAPMGYINVERNGRRYIHPDPEMSPVIKKLFESYATGNYSLNTIVDMIHEEGLAYKKSGAKIYKSRIHQILKNPIYRGEFEWKGKLYQGIHEPIVSIELWETVQNVLAGNGSRRTQQQKREWAFQGLVSCGHCGCAMVAEIKKGRYVYYHCTGHKGKCPEKYVREEVLADQFGDALKAIRLNGDVLEWVISALRSGHDDEKRYHDEVIASLQRDYAKLQHRIDQMYVDKLDGKITQEFYNEKSFEWRNDQTASLKKMEKHQNANASYLEEGIRILELSNRAWNLYQKQEMDEKRRLLDFVFSNSSWKGGKLVPNYRKPFNLILEAVELQNSVEVLDRERDGKIARNEIWLPRLDSNQEQPG